MTKPEADPVAAVTLPEVPNVKHLWQRATLLWNGMFKFILNLVGALAFVLSLCYFTKSQLSDRSSLSQYLYLSRWPPTAIPQKLQRVGCATP